MEQLFTRDDIWLGGFFELAIELGRQPEDQPRVAPESLESGSHYLGIARLPNGSRVACGSVSIRESDRYDASDRPDWLSFYIPMGALANIYPVSAYPLLGPAQWGTGAWRQQVEQWFVGTGHHISRSAGFRLALIGGEVSGWQYADQIAVTGIPEKRYIGYLWPSGENIVYYPSNV